MPRVLVLAGDETEREVLQQVLAPYALSASASTISEMQRLLEHEQYDAVFCAWSLSKGNWRDALGVLRQSRPELPVIIFCRAGGEKEWLEVLSEGAFDLLVPPVSESQVRGVLEHALASREARLLHDSVARRMSNPA